jgi:hypothetical protein
MHEPFDLFTAFTCSLGRVFDAEGFAKLRTMWPTHTDTV